jgi:exodeoxyribonuclease V alpha subunit
MAKLVEAVPDGARLVLLGDPDQLPSVEAGDVLSGILAAAGTDEAPSPTFPGRRIHLQRSWRQHEALQLAPLATAVREGDSTTALSLLRGGTLSNVHFHEAMADPLQAHRVHLLAHWRSLANVSNPAEALALASRLRLLTAVREGPQGARTLNARIETLLAETGLHGPRRGAGPGHFHGRLLLITENSYRHRLFNGDIGICLRDTDGTVMAWFPGDTPDNPRAFHPATLPAHDSAFAMTVHKAQGSEFDEVWLLLPARDSRVLSRELVYTGITRARRELHVAGSAGVIEAALARHASRWSGLGWRLESAN